MMVIFNSYLIIIIGCLVLLALAQGIGVTSLTTYIVNVVPQNRSTVMSFNSSFLYLGLTLGSGFGAVLYSKINFSGISIFAAMALLVAVLMTYKLNNSHKK
jgi:Arabinose efflux permease